MTIDKKFKLFGKIGVLDILIVLIIVIGVLFALRFSVNTNAGAAAGTQKITYTVLLAKKLPGFEKDIIAGQKVFDSLNGGEIGVVLGYEIRPNLTTYPNLTTGQLVQTQVEGLNDIEVTISADAKLLQDAVMIGDYDVPVGKEMFIKTKSFASTCFCIKLDLEGGQQQ
jgi:hypothetical protein